MHDTDGFAMDMLIYGLHPSPELSWFLMQMASLRTR